MHICHIDKRGSIRTIKQMLALKDKGHTVELISTTAPYAFNLIDRMTVYFGLDQLASSVKLSQADIFHYHSVPYANMPVVKEAAGRRPVIFDLHDLDSLQFKAEPSQEEKEAFTCADGFVQVSEGLQKESELRHGNGKPTVIVHPWVNQFLLFPIKDPHWKSIVYQGQVAPPTPYEDINANDVRLNYRDWSGIAETITGQGYHFFLYPNEPLDDPTYAYQRAGATVHQPLSYDSLLQTLRFYAFGLVGAPEPLSIFETAMPNKLFDYIAAGVVPIILNAVACAKFVRDLGIGIELDGLNDLEEQLRPGPECRKRLLALRDDLTMERHIDSLIIFYENLINAQRYL